MGGATQKKVATSAGCKKEPVNAFYTNSEAEKLFSV